MTRYFRKLSIRNKLTLITMTACGGAILVACLGFGIYDVLSVRNAMRLSLSTQGAIVAGNSTASLSFGDQNDAASILKSLQAERQVEVAAVFTVEGRALASYARDPSLAPLVPAAPGPDGARFGDNWLEVLQPVMLDGRRLGTVYLRADLTDLHKRVRNYILILLTLMALATATALLLVSRSQKFITEPILRLAQTARGLTVNADYSVRAVKMSDDEVGVLTDTFNQMLQQMQARDAELAAHREHLEQQVQRRTAELQQVNRQLSGEKERAEASNRAKSAFLANMSHEIRTPMTAIVGYADVMLDPDQTLSDRQDCLQVIRRNGRHLTDLINDILDVSKIEAGKMTVEPVSTNLPELVSDLISMLRPRAAAKGLAFMMKTDGPIPAQINTDPLRLRQVLMNLLGNAIKFTQHGQVILGLALEKAGSRNVLRFDIHDTGIGISDATLPKLFQSFSQADDSMTRRFGGTGLGLAISLKLAQLLGGGITVTSRPGSGSTFTVRVDAGSLEGTELIEKLTESILPRPVGQQSAAGLISLHGKILLVEDGLDNQQLIAMHLRKAGAVVDIAENGRIGVTKIMEATAGNTPYELVLMDMQMPELDGYGATSELRGKGIRIPIIALTAHAMAEDRDKCINTGCTDYLTKPIEKQKLLETVSIHLANARQAEGTIEVTNASAPDRLPVAAGALRSDFANDADMAEILGDFIKSLPTKVARIQSLVDNNDLDELCRVVHQLKGAGGGYGFSPITQRAAAAEKRLKSGDPIEQIATDVQSLITLIRSVEGYQVMNEAVR